MHLESPPKIRSFVLVGNKFRRTWLFSLIITNLVLNSLVSVHGQDEESFCSHSVSKRNPIELEQVIKSSSIVWDDSNNRKRRFVKRQVARQNQNRADGSGGQAAHPQNQQEDQIIIDESDAKSSPPDDSSGRTDARIDCSRSVSSSRPGTSSSGKNDCDTSQLPPAAQVEQKVIETAVFIDQALDNKFIGLGNGLVELNKLVLNIMNQVQHLFRYSSMKVPIKIKLVLVEHLKDSEKNGNGPAPNSEKGDIDVYLSNFCNWQYRKLERDKHRIWWDHAILLSGLDLFKATPGKNHTGVLGLAWVGGMCKGNYSCTINEASNLESAFVIAHEIGHSLGIMHDGQRNNCDPNGFIMSERTGAGKVHWSRCSINYLKDSLQRRLLNCLETEQSPTSDSLYDLSKLRPPGQVYTINDQCKLAFGSNYTSYVTRQSPFNSVCRELWCVAGTWAKAAHPALEGSACGDQDRICREGKCLK